MNIDNYRILSPGQRRGRIDWIVILCNNLQIETEGGSSRPAGLLLPSGARGESGRLETITPPLNRVVTGYARTANLIAEMCSEAPARPSDASVSTRYTVPFKFIYDKDGQAHQHHRHQHDDCGAAVDAVAGVHQRSFEGESMKEKLRAHVSGMRTNPVVGGTPASFC